MNPDPGPWDADKTQNGNKNNHLSDVDNAVNWYCQAGKLFLLSWPVPNQTWTQYPVRKFVAAPQVSEFAEPAHQPIHKAIA